MLKQRLDSHPVHNAAWHVRRDSVRAPLARTDNCHRGLTEESMQCRVHSGGADTVRCCEASMHLWRKRITSTMGSHTWSGLGWWG